MDVGGGVVVGVWWHSDGEGGEKYSLFLVVLHFTASIGRRDLEVRKGKVEYVMCMRGCSGAEAKPCLRNQFRG